MTFPKKILLILIRVIALNLDDREDKELRKLLYDGSVKLLAYITRPKFIKSGNN